MLIVEDDPYRELFFEDSASEARRPPDQADDEEGRVVYLSSFSKTLAPGFRVAWIDAPRAARLEARDGEAGRRTCSRAASISGSSSKPAAAESCSVSCRCCARHYQHKRDVMVQALRAVFGNEVTLAGAARRVLPLGDAAGGIDADRMLTRAVEHGVIYVAGEAFFVSGPGRTGAQHRAPVVLGARARSHPRRRHPSCARPSGPSSRRSTFRRGRRRRQRHRLARQRRKRNDGNGGKATARQRAGSTCFRGCPSPPRPKADPAGDRPSSGRRRAWPGT